MLIDRNELEGQLLKNIIGYGFKTVNVPRARRTCRTFSPTDYRGLVVSMIHKFDDIPANINTRDSVVCWWTRLIAPRAATLAIT